MLKRVYLGAALSCSALLLASCIRSPEPETSAPAGGKVAGMPPAKVQPESEGSNTSNDTAPDADAQERIGWRRLPKVYTESKKEPVVPAQARVGWRRLPAAPAGPRVVTLHVKDMTERMKLV